jgi:hypothetical protein
LTQSISASQRAAAAAAATAAAATTTTAAAANIHAQGSTPTASPHDRALVPAAASSTTSNAAPSSGACGVPVPVTVWSQLVDRARRLFEAATKWLRAQYARLPAGGIWRSLVRYCIAAVLAFVGWWLGRWLFQRLAGSVVGQSLVQLASLAFAHSGRVIANA